MAKKKSLPLLLIVEDEKPIAHALQLKLASEGYRTYITSDGHEALNALSSQSFDGVLLDLIMPRKDGFAVLAEMKEKNNKIPIIILSNLGQESDKVRCKELGAAGYFVKADISIADAVRAIKQYV